MKADAPKKILVVEDEEMILSLMTRFLRMKKYNVLTATSGEEALDIIQREKDVFYCFIDLNLPRISGVELMQKIHRTTSCQQICLMSGDSKDILQEKYNISNVHCFLQKPFSMVTLAETIEKVHSTS